MPVPVSAAIFIFLFENYCKDNPQEVEDVTNVTVHHCYRHHHKSFWFILVEQNSISLSRHDL